MRISTLMPFVVALPSAFAAKKPVKPELGNTTNAPLHIGLVTFPGFQALDVFGPMDVLNSLSLLFSVPLKLSVLSKTLDGVTTSVTSAMPNMSHNDFGESIVPTITFADYLARSKAAPAPPAGPAPPSGKPKPSAAPGHGHKKRHAGHGDEKSCKKPAADKGDIEVLLIPGGGGTRQPLKEEIEFVKIMYPKVKYVLTVCTGATILSRAGGLDGRKATTNKLAWPWATSQGPKTKWIGKARWVNDGNIWSSSGVSAGSDMMYAWVGHVWGKKVSDYLSKAAEYTRWEDANNDPFADIWGATDVN